MRPIRMPQTRDIFVIGSINLDSVTEFNNLEHKGPSTATKHPGGHGANQAVACFRSSHYRTSRRSFSSDDRRNSNVNPQHPTSVGFEVAVHLFGCVGNDRHDIRRTLNENGVKTEGVTTSDLETSQVTVFLTRPGSKITTLTSNHDNAANESFEQLPDFSCRPAAVLLQGEIREDVTVRAVRKAKEAGSRVFFNAAPFNSAKVIHPSLYKVDHFIVNKTIADGLASNPCQYTDPEGVRRHYWDCCNTFHDRGAQTVVITMGEYGAVASSTGRYGPKRVFVSALKGPGEVRDPTGASDAFIGAYVTEIVRQDYENNPGQEPRDEGRVCLERALEEGVRAGGLCVAGLGSLDSIPWRDEVEDAVFEAIWDPQED